MGLFLFIGEAYLTWACAKNCKYFYDRMKSLENAVVVGAKDVDNENIDGKYCMVQGPVVAFSSPPLTTSEGQPVVIQGFKRTIYKLQWLIPTNASWDDWCKTDKKVVEPKFSVVPFAIQISNNALMETSSTSKDKTTNDKESKVLLVEVENALEAEWEEIIQSVATKFTPFHLNEPAIKEEEEPEIDPKNPFKYGRSFKAEESQEQVLPVGQVITAFGHVRKIGNRYTIGLPPPALLKTQPYVLGVLLRSRIKVMGEQWCWRLGFGFAALCFGMLTFYEAQELVEKNWRSFQNNKQLKTFK